MLREELEMLLSLLNLYNDGVEQIFQLVLSLLQQLLIGRPVLLPVVYGDWVTVLLFPVCFLVVNWLVVLLKKPLYFLL